MEDIRHEFSKDSSVVKQVTQQFQSLNLRQARSCIYLDSILLIAQILAYSKNHESNDLRGETLGLEKGELGDASHIVNKLWPTVATVVIFCILSHFWRMKFLIQLSIIIVLVR